jgi:isoleucyl-tRNA synthetase
MMTAVKKKDAYRHTLQLPRTEFSMRANLLQKEPQFQKRWAAMNLYDRVQEREHPAGDFVFHDGPPYANGSIHMGHLLNKILKDLVVRSRSMTGHNVPYVPGWDCHGLPIEHKVMKEIGPEAVDLSTMDIRNKCAKYAGRFMKLQAKEMLRLGTLADYERPYFTMDPAYEGAVLEVFATLVGEGLVYRDLKPVHWSIENQTALADAELEYYDREDTSVFVFFDLEKPSSLPPSLELPEGEGACLIIWTTTPWTLPANMAVAAAASADYGLFRFEHAGTTRHAVLAENLRQTVLGEGAEQLGRCRGEDLVGLTYRHPFIERSGRVVTAPYVTLEDGTGLVHTAPGHGAEDYMTGLKEGLDVYCPVQADGTFDETVPTWLQGLVVWDANDEVVDRLRASGHLWRDERFTHSYPHDWRGKTPTIFRATEQWFIAVDEAFGEAGRSLRQRADEAAADHIRFVPDWGRNRLRGMLESRPDWCISRQRSWGLPIPAFSTADGELLLTAASVRAVAERVREKGSNAWFLEPPADLLQHYDASADVDAPAGIRNGGAEALIALERAGTSSTCGSSPARHGTPSCANGALGIPVTCTSRARISIAAGSSCHSCPGSA